MRCGVGRMPTIAVFAMFTWSPWAVLTLTQTSWRAFPRGADPHGHWQPRCAREQVAISKSSSLSGWAICCTALAFGACGQPPPIFGIRTISALGVELGQVGILEDLAVDRHRHALLDLAAEGRVPLGF